jgi:hypothetical protein
VIDEGEGKMKNKKAVKVVEVRPNIEGVPDVVEVNAEEPNWKVADGVLGADGKPTYIIGQIAVIPKGKRMGTDQYDVAIYDMYGNEQGRLHLIKCDVLDKIKDLPLVEA